ncbi:MAG: DJ-1/PfpI family protein, partial [Gemmatimonadota bacterium]
IGGLRVRPERRLADVAAPEIVVVPGGDGTRREMENRALLRWLREAHEGVEVMLSVCSGARLLARAGLLDGLRVTTHHQVVDHLRELAPAAIVEPTRRYIDAGKIVTTGGISAGIDGAFHVVERLWGPDIARATAAYMEYDRR